MPEVTYLAPAKINLFLHINSKRADGYHNLQTIFQLLDYGDEITFSLRNDGEIKRIYGNETISPDKDLILRSAKTLKKYCETEAGVDIGVIKKIPIGGGLRSEEHTSELQSRRNLVCRLLLEKKNNNKNIQ